MIDKRERVYQAFGTFLVDYVKDLNDLSGHGWSLLVEGPRDLKAMRSLGYRGRVVTVSLLGRNGVEAFGDAKRAIILTDLDREGTALAAKFTRLLEHEGMVASLRERRRLKAASRGVFLHVENLARFARPEASQWSDASGTGPGAKTAKVYREGLRRYRRPPQGG